MTRHPTPFCWCDLPGDPHLVQRACDAPEQLRLCRLIRNVTGWPGAFYEAAARPVLEDALRCDGRRGDPARSCRVLERLGFVHRALAIRRGHILPPGVDAETWAARAHRWTYGVFLAALFAPLCANGNALADAAASPQDRCEGWRPVSERIPAKFLRWIEDDPQLLRELCEWTTGHPHDAGGVIGGILRQAGPARVVPDWIPAMAAREPPAPPAAAPAVASAPQAEAPALAVAFMHWLDAALVAGHLSSNETGAAVHGVEEGLLLVSPRIFRLFAAHLAREAPVEPVVTEAAVQRALLRAGWHERAPRGVNMLRYEVTGNGQPGVFLNGVVIAGPQRFVSRAPVVNPSLRRVRAA